MNAPTQAAFGELLVTLRAAAQAAPQWKPGLPHVVEVEMVGSRAFKVGLSLNA